MTSTTDQKFIDVKNQVIRTFEEKSEINGVRSEIKTTSDGPAIILELAEPNERFYSIVSKINASLDHSIVSTVLLQKGKPKGRFLLQKPDISPGYSRNPSISAGRVLEMRFFLDIQTRFPMQKTA